MDILPVPPFMLLKLLATSWLIPCELELDATSDGVGGTGIETVVGHTETGYSWLRRGGGGNIALNSYNF